VLNYIENQCNHYYQQIVIMEAGERCEFCGDAGTIFSPLAAHHSIFKSQQPAYSIRYDWKLGICLCQHHHAYAHDNAIEFMIELKKRISPEKFLYIQKIKNTPWVKSCSDLREWRAKLKKKYQELIDTAYMNLEVDLPVNHRWKQL